ncbi:M4 family metallopeptidase [Nocardioides carbamazepini]|uniref:M4 family metallopeptidase n=1 Tax=Nocardioides carbamazepini TaxID=2854259 RepID=UPI002149C037|nr:M4 family metallopeptidase [Nocardioides carbamazepini]MCR1783183.1 M4 family metallopeptidase [Nocardioides carbamazepini]
MRLNLPDALRKGVGLSLVGAALVVIPSAPIQAAPQDPSVTQQMRNEAEGKVAITTSPATDKVGFVRATKDLFPSERSARTADGAAAKASGYVDKYARAFGATAAQLKQGEVTETPAGYTVDFDQTYQGVPVFGAKLRAHVDNQGDLTSVSGYVAPKVDLAVTPRLDEAAATATAIKLAAQAPAGAGEAAPDKPEASSLKATKADLMVYRMGAIQGVEGRNLLAWVVEVTDGKQVRETSVLDAVTGKPVNRYSMIAHALDRELIEAYDDPDANPDLVWKEGDAWPTSRTGGDLDEDQQNEVQGTGEAYWFFKNSFGRDSYDGAGALMKTVNNDPNIACPNANWNGVSTNYCSGVSSDDTVAHEWGHAYTEKTSGLLYQWQPGAMNEAYSDIWGETVDMLNSRYNDVTVEAGGEEIVLDEETHRSDDGRCSLATPGDLTFTINSPAAVAGPCAVVKPSWSADFGDPFDPENEGVTADVVVATDTDADEGSTTDGCDAVWANAAQIAGKIAFVDRGLCTFQEKIDHAVANGATGLVIGNNTAGMINPGGTAPAGFYGATLSQADGTKIKSAGTANVTIFESVANRDETARWLSGEDDPAFGGAIRDMWSPNCYGDPGKVSDEEYACDTGDNGGVHTNSGVVNHTYALLVDGGTYNGVTVPGIGLDKAAHIFWRTQTAYLTPTSGFVELADGLEGSCATLTGNTTLKKLAVGDSATGGSAADEGTIAPIAAADCAAVTKAIAATELRKEPVQCNFKPMFHRGAVGCGEGTVTKSQWTEGFESGIPAGWTQDVEYYDDPESDGGGAKHFDTTTTTALPVVSKGGVQHKGGPSVLYFNDKGDDGNFGSCSLDSDDYSSRVGLATPVLTVPAGDLPRFTFDHYVATEVGFDGGNVKVKVNGAPEFELVPDRAWLYNAPGGELESAAAGNTNPMAGETAFTGADGGLPTGQWGHSAIDLSMLAKPGDTVQFRFDFGMDGCNGNDGWYVDNVAVSICTTPDVAPGTATVSPKASAKKGTVTIMINTAGGVMPSGLVTVTIKGKTYTGTVVDGVLKVKAKKQLRKLWRQGKRKVKATVSYPGDAKIAPFSGKVTIKLKGKQ